MVFLRYDIVSFLLYKKLLSCSGYGLDFSIKFGMPLCLINFGIYGFCILLYLNTIFALPVILPFLPEGVGITGPTAGIVFAALDLPGIGNLPAAAIGGVLTFYFSIVFSCSIGFSLFKASDRLKLAR